VIVIYYERHGQLRQAEKHQMSIPPELRVLNHQLSTVPTAQLPQITPLLLRNVLRCQGPLSAPSTNAAKDDSSEASAVHTLKTHVSRLLFGRSAEGRFAAIILAKGIIDVGGWEVLRGALKWVQGLLAILTVSKSTTVFDPDD
jgi:pre-rRNA-processing protein RIX1